MEIKNFNGKAIEIIEAYINESPTMDTYTSKNYVSLVASIIRGATITTLLDIYSDLDLKKAYLEREIHALQCELASRKGKLKVYDQEDKSAGEEVLTLAREINERSSRQGYCKNILDVTSTVKDFTEENLTGQINALTDDEKAKLKESFTEIIDTNTSKISTLNKEIASRLGKMNSKDSLKEESVQYHMTPAEYSAKLNNEASTRDHRKRLLEHYNEVLEKFTPPESKKTK